MDHPTLQSVFANDFAPLLDHIAKAAATVGNALVEAISAVQDDTDAATD